MKFKQNKKSKEKKFINFPREGWMVKPEKMFKNHQFDQQNLNKKVGPVRLSL